MYSSRIVMYSSKLSPCTLAESCCGTVLWSYEQRQMGEFVQHVGLSGKSVERCIRSTARIIMQWYTHTRNSA